MKDYYHFLGVSETSSVDEIKRAYRRKVSTVHPDVNPSPNANDEFIELNEAYEHLIKAKTGFVFDNTTDQYAKPRRAPAEADFVDEARARAREYAKKEYSEFVNSSYYKTHIALFSIFDYFMFGLMSVVFIAFFIYTSIYLGVVGIIITTLIVAVFIPFFIHSFKNIATPSKADAINALKMVVSHDMFSWSIMTIFNLIAFFQYAFVTFLPFKFIAGLYLLVPSVAQLIYSILGRTRAQDPLVTPFRIKKPITIIWGVFPLLFSMYLLTNYQFSSNERVETYSYHEDYDSDGSFCVLENNKYEEYGGIRFVFLDSNFYDNQFVTYTIADGYWGVDVLKKYSLSTTRKP